jgi:hypothetical protein
LGVAVRTQESKVAQPIVVAPAIDMVQLKRDPRAVPTVAATDLAPSPLDSSSDQPLLQFGSAAEAALDQNVLQRYGRNDRRPTTSSPALARKVRRINAHRPNPEPQLFLDSAAGLVPQFGQRLGERTRRFDRIVDLVLRIEEG